MTRSGEVEMNNEPRTDEPLGLPKGSVRSLLSLGVLGAFAIAAYLLAANASSDLTLRLALTAAQHRLRL
jgi:hypothetical protein